MLKCDEDFVNLISSKVCDTLMNNDIFKQLLFDAMSLEFKISLSRISEATKLIKKDDLELKKTN